jgi:membrane carboxypeptidase/penicillin-binding protein
VTGGSYPAEMWGDYMEVALANYESVDFNEPDGTRAGRQLEKPEIEQNIDPELLQEFLEFQRENPDE